MKIMRPLVTTKEPDISSKLAYYMNLPYEISIRPDECDGKLCYMAIHPELYGCMAQGATPEEAMSNLKVAREDYIAALLGKGLHVPMPRNVSAKVG